MQKETKMLHLKIMHLYQLHFKDQDKTSVTGNTYNLSVVKAGYDATKSVKMKLKSLYH